MESIKVNNNLKEVKGTTFRSVTDMYTIEFSCQNCRNIQFIHNIPKEIPVEQYLEFVKCKFCDCYLIQNARRKSI